MSKIVTLKDNTTKRPIYPITSTKAVIDDNGNSVESLMKKIHTDSEGFVISEDTIITNTETPEEIDISIDDVVLKIPQNLGENEKLQARQNIGAADDTRTKDILEKLFQNIGLDKIEIYSLEKYYHPGDIVMYDLILYQFTKEHPEGFWESSHVKRISIMDVIIEQLKTK